MLSKEEIETCKEELNNYIEFMETAGDNAGWARGILWYINQLEKDNHSLKIISQAEIEQREILEDEKQKLIEKLEKDTIPKQVIEDLNKEYLEKMKEYQERSKGDEEARHIAEDDLLCELLYKLGFKEVVSQYIKTSKWYA